MYSGRCGRENRALFFFFFLHIIGVDDGFHGLPPLWVYTSKETDTNAELLSRTVWVMTPRGTSVWGQCRMFLPLYLPLCLALFREWKVEKIWRWVGGGERTVAEVSCIAAAAAAAAASQLSGGRRGHLSLSRRCSLQCRRPPRLRLCGRTDRLKYWGCRDRQGLSFGKLVALLSYNGFIYSHWTFMLRLANPTSIAPDVFWRLKGRVLLLLHCTDNISLFFLLHGCI